MKERNGGFEQRPTPPNEWLYEDESADVRNFWEVMFIPDGEQPLEECTDEEKIAWEEAHKQEPEHAEVVE